MYDWEIPAEGSPGHRRRFEKLGDPVVDDFSEFLALALRSTKGYRPTALQLDMAEWLAYGPEKRELLGFRGVAKSWLAGILTSWLVLRDFLMKDGQPDINVIVVSGTHDKAHEFATYTRQLFYEIPLLRDLIPTDPTRWSTERFDVEGAQISQVGTVTSRAIFGRMAGERGDVIIGDDLELPQNSETVQMRDKLARRVADFPMILKPGGEIILLGTPHTEESLYNALSESGYSRRFYPMEFVSSNDLGEWRGDVAPFCVRPPNDPLLGTCTDPIRFDIKEVESRKAVRSSYEMQCMLRTTLGDLERYPLKLRDLIFCDLDYEVGPEYPIWSGDPKYAANDIPSVGLHGDSWQRPMGYRTGEDGSPRFGPYQGVVCAIDPSGKGSNETAWSLVAAQGGFLYLLEHGADVRGFTEEVLARILATCKRAKCRSIVYEENYGGGMFGAVLQGYFSRFGYAATIEPITHSQFKEARIVDSLEPVFNAHRLVVASRCVSEDPSGQGEGGHRYRLWYQATRLQKLRGALAFDDRIDSLAIAVAHWMGQMNVVQESFVADRMRGEHSAAIQAYWADVRRGQPRPVENKALSNRGFHYGDPRIKSARTILRA